MRRTIHRLELHTLVADSPSFRAKPQRFLLSTVQHSPYKDSFKEYWSTPIPWQKREYGRKPKAGEPIPLRDAATTLVVGKNNHIDPAKVKSGEDNDYKVLMMFRQAKGRYVKDQFVLPGKPVHLTDLDSDWAPMLQRNGVVTAFPDLARRICAMRALFVAFNVLVLPKEGGGLAEVEGPPGSRRWFSMVSQYPTFFRQMLDILEVPLEGSFQSLLPFRRIQTPATELFRFDSMTYIVPFDKIAEVKYTLTTVNEELCWVSPKEALARYDAGIMDMPTPNLILMQELALHHPTFDTITSTLTPNSTASVIVPELVHDPETRMGTVLLPGDIHHSATLLEGSPATSALTAAVSTTSTPVTVPQLAYRRLRYEKDEPWGVRAVFVRRPIEADEPVEALRSAEPMTVQDETNEGLSEMAAMAGAPPAEIDDGGVDTRALQPAELQRRKEELQQFQQTLTELRGSRSTPRSTFNDETPPTLPPSSS